MSRLTQDGAAEPVSRDQILRREHGQGNINFPCSAGHEQDYQPYPCSDDLKPGDCEMVVDGGRAPQPCRYRLFTHMSCIILYPYSTYPCRGYSTHHTLTPETNLIHTLTVGTVT